MTAYSRGEAPQEPNFINSSVLNIEPSFVRQMGNEHGGADTPPPTVRNSVKIAEEFKNADIFYRAQKFSKHDRPNLLSRCDDVLQYRELIRKDFSYPAHNPVSLFKGSVAVGENHQNVKLAKEMISAAFQDHSGKKLLILEQFPASLQEDIDAVIAGDGISDRLQRHCYQHDANWLELKPEDAQNPNITSFTNIVKSMQGRRDIRVVCADPFDMNYESESNAGRSRVVTLNYLIEAQFAKLMHDDLRSDEVANRYRTLKNWLNGEVFAFVGNAHIAPTVFDESASFPDSGAMKAAKLVMTPKFDPGVAFRLNRAALIHIFYLALNLRQMAVSDQQDIVNFAGIDISSQEVVDIDRAIKSVLFASQDIDFDEGIKQLLRPLETQLDIGLSLESLQKRLITPVAVRSLNQVIDLGDDKMLPDDRLLVFQEAQSVAYGCPYVINEGSMTDKNVRQFAAAIFAGDFEIKNFSEDVVNLLTVPRPVKRKSISNIVASSVKSVQSRERGSFAVPLFSSQSSTVPATPARSRSKRGLLGNMPNDSAVESDMSGFKQQRSNSKPKKLWSFSDISFAGRFSLDGGMDVDNQDGVTPMSLETESGRPSSTFTYQDVQTSRGKGSERK